MTQDKNSLYKLMILYLLNRVDFPLTKAQVSEFMLGYTDFISLQQVFTDLTETGMVVARVIGSRTNLLITDGGRDALKFFGTQIGETLRVDMDTYLELHSMTLREEVSITSQYRKVRAGEYETHLIALEKGLPLVDLKLSVPDEESAQIICDNWKEKNQEVYQALIGILF